jgi:hypothetical protein
MAKGNRRLNSLVDCRRFNQWLINSVIAEKMPVETGSKLGSLVNTQMKIIIAIADQEETGLSGIEERLDEHEKAS